jgi:hypothetical protein
MEPSLQTEIDTLGTVEPALQELASECAKHLQAARSGTPMKGAYFKIFGDFRNLLLYWMAREPNVHYPELTGESGRDNELSVIFVNVRHQQEKLADIENKLAKREFKDLQEEDLRRTKLYHYVCLREYQSKLFNVYVAEEKAAAASARPKPAEPDSAAAGSEKTGDMPLRRAEFPKMPTPVPVDRGGKTAREKTVKPMSDIEAREYRRLKDRVQELLKRRGDLIPIMNARYQRVHHDSPASASLFSSFLDNISGFDDVEREVANNERDLLENKLNQKRVYTAGLSDDDDINTVQMIREIDLRISRYQELLRAKLQECPENQLEAKRIIIGFLDRLGKELQFLARIKSSLREELESSQADWKAQRLHMLLDSPSLYKAWLLASTPEEGCSSGT